MTNKIGENLQLTSIVKFLPTPIKCENQSRLLSFTKLSIFQQYLR